MQLIELRCGHTGVKWGPNPTPRVSLEKTSMGWQQAESRSQEPRIVRDRQEANDSPPGFKRNKALLTPSFWTSGPQNGETIHFCVVFFFLWCFKPPGLLNFLKATLGHEYKFQKQWWWTVTLSTRGQKLNDPRSAAFSEEVNSTSLYPQKLPGRSLPRVCPRTMQKGPRSDVALRVISHERQRCGDPGRPGIRLFLTCSIALFLLICSSWNRGSSPSFLRFCLQWWFGSGEDGRRPCQWNEMIYKTCWPFRNFLSFHLGSFPLNKNCIVNQIHCWGLGSRIFLISVWHV